MVVQCSLTWADLFMQGVLVDWRSTCSRLAIYLRLISNESLLLSKLLQITVVFEYYWCQIVLVLWFNEIIVKFSIKFYRKLLFKWSGNLLSYLWIVSNYHDCEHYSDNCLVLIHIYFIHTLAHMYAYTHSMFVHIFAYTHTHTHVHTICYIAT